MISSASAVGSIVTSARQTIGTILNSKNKQFIYNNISLIDSKTHQQQDTALFVELLTLN